mgnify:CR=1 FL=1
MSTPSVFQIGQTEDAKAKSGQVDKEYEQYATLFRETDNHEERKVRKNARGGLCHAHRPVPRWQHLRQCTDALSCSFLSALDRRTIC